MYMNICTHTHTHTHTYTRAHTYIYTHMNPSNNLLFEGAVVALVSTLLTAEIIKNTSYTYIPHNHIRIYTYIHIHIYIYVYTSAHLYFKCAAVAFDSALLTAKIIKNTGWRRLIGSPKLQIIFHKRATKYRSLLQKMTYKVKGSYESSPPCTSYTHVPHVQIRIYTYIHM